MLIRVYNYNTMDKLKQFEAHNDYIRCVAVHPTLPLLLSSSDDMLIKLWNWEKGWMCTQIFEGHTHYVMQVIFNPKDTNTFASASLDRTIKVRLDFFYHSDFQFFFHGMNLCRVSMSYAQSSKNHDFLYRFGISAHLIQILHWRPTQKE